MTESNSFINYQLFSEVYLRELRQDRISPEIPAAAQQIIREWRAEYANLENINDLMSYLAQCLSSLGFNFQRQDPLTQFVLYADDTQAQPLGLCLVVADQNIDRMTKGRHHHATLIKRLADLHLSWGILTNSHDWRLCYAKDPAPYEVYLQANLDSLLNPHSLPAFSQFFRFFSRSAFSFSSSLNGKPPQQGLDILLAESEKATQSIERHLKNRVDDVLQKLCLGFVEDKSSPDLLQPQRDEIYHNAIVLLYRVLFLFYAEARRLLPVEDDSYHQVSLQTLVADSLRFHQEGLRDPNPYSLWARLSTLCGIVDIGDQGVSVNPYNGGLFSDAENPYLRTHRIRDDYLAPALYYLAFMETKTGLQPIEYRDLSVRHLGTLYEGMLEYSLKIVSDEPVVVREAKGKRTYTALSIANPKKGETILPIGQVYFADDKGERKSSGSYYTPEDVVQYIVSQTLLPKLEQRAAPLRALASQAQHDRQIAVTPSERISIESAADRQSLKLVEENFLSLKILDPAMGSAHFLVIAGQMLSNFIVSELNALDWPGEIPTDPLLWKRRVVERCLYGVDVNPLAQELAKLSLWLTSAAAGKPLTFLDHHLKVGNSLYGAPLTRLAALPSVTPALDDSHNLFLQPAQQIIQAVLQELQPVNQQDSNDINIVKAKIESYQNAQTLSLRLRDFANVWLTSLFGLSEENKDPITADQYLNLLSEVLIPRSNEEWEGFASEQSFIQEARVIAQTHHFFHWELEFPDTLENEKCQFDIVIANPPYVGTSPSLLISILYKTAKCCDLYAWLIEQALYTTSSTANIGMIIPLSIMFAGDKSSLREILLSEKSTIHLISFDNRPDAIFEAPGFPPNRQRTTIVLIHRTKSQNRILTSDYLRWIRSERSQLFQNINFADTTHFASKTYFPSIGKNSLVEFYSYLLKCPKTINDYVQKKGDEFLCVPSAACYYISAVPLDLGRRNQEILRFQNKKLRDALFAIINSNVFYWYWRSRSDGFWISCDQILSFPLPDLDKDKLNLLDLASALWDRSNDIAINQVINRKMVTSYLFNKRMDILLGIDEWIINHVAPDLDLPRDVFAQYKSNSFMRPLDIKNLGLLNTENEE